MPARRVGILSFQHESNTFSGLPTNLDDFAIGVGDELVRRWGGSHSEVAGFIKGLEAENLEAVPLFMAVATPSGTVTSEAFTQIVDSIQDALETGPDLDGLLVAPHGAGVSEREPDMDGFWLQAVRKIVGDDLPVICTLDLHANVSARMIDACDATIAYRTNPHLDTFERGLEAATLMARTLRAEVRPVQSCSRPPVSINILTQGTSAPPCSTLAGVVNDVRRREGVLSAGVCLGFPFADVAEMGTSFNVVTDGDAGLAEELAAELAGYLVEHRHDFDPIYIYAPEAVERASALEGPVCLLDTGDNVGGGSAGDGTVIAHEVARRGGPRTFVCLYEPEAVAQLEKLGAGGRTHLMLGGRQDDLHGSPLELDVTVRGRHDGRFTETEVRHGGKTDYDMGATVVVDSDAGLTLQLTSRRIVPFSLNQLLHCDIDPAEFQIIVAKGVHAPAAAYEPVCSELIRVTTPGATTPDMSKLRFEHVRRPLHPLDRL
ncbi:MAG: M81 family metallopeptidase [Actinomycetota bacterium]